MEADFRISELDQLDADTVTGLFGRCVAVGRWARELADGRPYADLPALLTRADELTAGLTDHEIRQALDDHPRIGRRPATDSATAAWSTQEQSGVDSGDTDVAERLVAANAAYEDRFGHLYLVCATGRDATDLLADIAKRMRHDPVTELSVVRTELGKIARLRLEKAVRP
jgi:2-oxo-4-hydroxy-4-carboxy-5-ureidoimidazoline decarboxylase